jgi:hypothetical protein
MSVQSTIDSLVNFCQTNTGTPDQWQGNQNTYRWNVGREIVPGAEVNGVVRKLAGIDPSGGQLWVVAGSFKIDAQGQILRFTGLPRKHQKVIQTAIQITIDTPVLETV